MSKTAISLTVNGQRHEVFVEPRKLLSDVIREDLGLTGTHVGCEHGVCGSCTILFDGRAARSCLMFAIQAQGHELTTIEAVAQGGIEAVAQVGIESGVKDGMAAVAKDGIGAVAQGGTLSALQQALHEEHGLQCGFCTPGIVMTLEPYLKDHPQPTESEIRDVLSGNLCRCTGYQNIVKAALKVTGSQGAGHRPHGDSNTSATDESTGVDHRPTLEEGGQ